MVNVQSPTLKVKRSRSCDDILTGSSRVTMRPSAVSQSPFIVVYRQRLCSECTVSLLLQINSISELSVMGRTTPRCMAVSNILLESVLAPHVARTLVCHLICLSLSGLCVCETHSGVVLSALLQQQDPSNLYRLSHAIRHIPLSDSEALEVFHSVLYGQLYIQVCPP